MQELVISEGILTIDKQFLNVENRCINITKIDSLEIVKMERHSLFSGIKLWFKGLLILIVFSLFHLGNYWISLIGDLYCCSIFLLLAFNLYRHCKLSYGLVIVAGGYTTTITSRKKDFICDVRDVLYEAMNHSIDEQIIINVSSNHFVNNGIVSNGNDNKNEVNL